MYGINQSGGMEEKQREAGASHAAECSEEATPTSKGYPELINQGLERINEGRSPK